MPAIRCGGDDERTVDFIFDGLAAALPAAIILKVFGDKMRRCTDAILGMSIAAIFDVALAQPNEEQKSYPRS